MFPPNRTQQLLFEPMVLKIGINGFGRIGRLVMRAAKADPAVQVRASPHAQ